MFTIDERLKGLPATKEQVINLYQSLNTPHLAIPKRQAGPAQSFVVALQSPQGCMVFVYLYLPHSNECAIYVSAKGTVSFDAYPAQEAEALSFVESMGFLMDSTNFSRLTAPEKEALMRSLPVFQSLSVDARKGSPTPAPGAPTPNLAHLGRLFGAFCLAICVAGCAHMVSDKDREQAEAHSDLAAQNLVRSPQVALKEVNEALALDPLRAEAWHIKALLLHHAFARLEEAKTAYLKTLDLKPTLTEARTNLGNLYMDEKRYTDAIAQYELALGDMLYGAPFIAHGNMGWAYYKLGDFKAAAEHLKASVTLNPKYCLGHFQLGQILDEQGRADEACKHYSKFREACPDRADAHHREGLCLARLGDRDGAMKSFDQCIEKAGDEDLKNLCVSAQKSVP